MENITRVLYGAKRDPFLVGTVIELIYEDNDRIKVRRFTGICISVVKRKGIVRYTLRNVVNGIPVEFSFDYHSPLILSLRKTSIFKLVSVSRSKLFYLRTAGVTKSRV